MNETDRELRNLTYAKVVELGRVPVASEVASALDSDLALVVAGWRRLHEQHALVLDPTTDEIRMAAPFSGVRTPYRVRALDRWWYANCAWDAFVVCASLHVSGRIETACPDCAMPISLDVREQRPDDESLLFHCLVPAAQWCDDIVFT